MEEVAKAECSIPRYNRYNPRNLYTPITVLRDNGYPENMFLGNTSANRYITPLFRCYVPHEIDTACSWGCSESGVFVERDRVLPLQQPAMASACSPHYFSLHRLEGKLGFGLREAPRRRTGSKVRDPEQQPLPSPRPLTEEVLGTKLME